MHVIQSTEIMLSVMAKISAKWWKKTKENMV